MIRSIHNENRAKKRAKKGGEKSGKRLHLIGFCPNGDRNTVSLASCHNILYYQEKGTDKS
jgi:hypothetical protein